MEKKSGRYFYIAKIEFYRTHYLVLREVLLWCLDVFPENYAEYKRAKETFKNKLKISMRILKEKLRNRILLKAFLSVGMFNGGEVDFLVVVEKENRSPVIYHLFFRDTFKCLHSTKLGKRTESDI